MKKLVVLIVAGFIGLGFKYYYGSMEERVESISSQNLVFECSEMLIKFHRTGKQHGNIPRNLWPDSVKTLRPWVVKTTQSGVFIQQGICVFRRKGIWVDISFLPHVACEDVLLTPGDTFKPLGNNLMWAEISSRSQQVE